MKGLPLFKYLIFTLNKQTVLHEIKLRLVPICHHPFILNLILSIHSKGLPCPIYIKLGVPIVWRDRVAYDVF